MTAEASRTFALLEQARASGGAPAIAEIRFVRLPGHVPPWTPTGVRVARGDWVTLLASGRLVLAEALDLWMPPSLALWARIGGRGPIVNGTRDTTSFRAEHDGEVELALYNGEWASPAGDLAIRVDTANTVGILQKPVDFALGPTTTLEWRWCVDELPARAAEDTPIAHDYLSLALAFENGVDLTWYWSAALPIGTHYACPLPTWAARETHWVVRSGGAGLGRWHAERRVIADDDRAAIGAPPARVGGVWLSAVSIFGHRCGRATFADVVLRDGGRELRVI